MASFSVSAFSTCSSRSNSSSGVNDENNNTDDDDEDDCESGPVVSWPKYVVELVKHLRPEPSTMVMPMPAITTMFRQRADGFRGNDSDDVSMTKTMYYGDSDQYCYYNQQQQSLSSSSSSGGWSSLPAKRVHFMDMPSQNAAASAEAAAAATAMPTGTVF